MEWNIAGSRRIGVENNDANHDGKMRVALKMADRLGDGDVVGIGSGSTSIVTLRALADRAVREGWSFTAIATSIEIELECHALHVPIASLLEHRPEWSFDGADEVDAHGDMIKGRGGAMVREKLVMASSLDRYVVVDRSKRVERLGRKVAVPLEIVPESLKFVCFQLESAFEVLAMELRLSDAKDGPVITERGNLIVDVKFSEADGDLDGHLNATPGVVGSGLFLGFNPTIISD